MKQVGSDRPRVLVVEDEWLIADYLAELLREAGFDVVGPASRVGDALAVVESERIDAGVLDVSLKRERSFAIAAELKRRAIPFLFMTGYLETDFPVEFHADLVLTKPAKAGELIACLRSLLAAGVEISR